MTDNDTGILFTRSTCSFLTPETLRSVVSSFWFDVISNSRRSTCVGRVAASLLDCERQSQTSSRRVPQTTSSFTEHSLSTESTIIHPYTSLSIIHSRPTSAGHGRSWNEHELIAYNLDSGDQKNLEPWRRQHKSSRSMSNMIFYLSSTSLLTLTALFRRMKFPLSSDVLLATSWL